MRPASEWLTALRTSFWFLPVLMAVAAAASARAALSWNLEVPLWRDTGGNAGSDALLSTLAGSLVTVTGVVFSLTVVTLHLASNQYGSRLLRSFMRDRGTQTVLGTFIATFVFCIVGLVGQPPLNSLAVALALVLAGASVGMLIYFIHHLAVSIQAETVVGAVADQLEEQIRRIYPRRRSPTPSGRLPAKGSIVVRSSRDGYVVSINRKMLFRAAVEAGADIQALVREGHYVVRGDPLLRVATSDRVPQPAISAVAVGPRRTEGGDPEFRVQQIAQMAVRALSPGINDPYTAVNCVDRLTSAYCQLGELDDGPLVEERDGVVVTVPKATFVELLDAGMGSIRQHAHSPKMQAHLLQAFGRVGIGMSDPGRRRQVRLQLEAMMEAARAMDHPRADLDMLEACFRTSLEHLDMTVAPDDLHRH